MIKPHVWFRGALAAWGMVIDFPLPGALRKYTVRAVPGNWVLAGFPLVGAAAGAVIALAAWLFSGVLNPVAGSLFFALAGLLFLDLKDFGRGIGLLTSFFELKARGIPVVEALPELDPDVSRIGQPSAVVLLAVLEILKLALLFLLSFYGAKLWLAAVLAGSFSLQGLLAALPVRLSGRPLLVLPGKNGRREFLATALALAVVWFVFFPLATLAAVLILYWLSGALGRAFDRIYGGVTADFITLSGVLAELLLLLIGIGCAITFS